MNKRLTILSAACFVLAACSPSAEEIKTILNAHIAGLGEEGSTSVISVEQTEKNIFSGTYSVSKDSLTTFVYPFTAIIKKDQVTQFFKDTDETKVKVVNKQTGTEETKAQYEERIKKEEEERIAAEKAKAKKAAAAAKNKGFNGVWVSSGGKWIFRLYSNETADIQLGDIASYKTSWTEEGGRAFIGGAGQTRAWILTRDGEVYSLSRSGAISRTNGIRMRKQ